MKLNKALVGSSLVLLITLNLYNFLNFGYQWSMARLLSIEDYRQLAVLISIVYLLGVFSESIQLIIVRYTSMQNNDGMLKHLLKRSFKWGIIVSSVLFIIYLLIAIILSPVLKIPYYLLAVNGILIFTQLCSPMTRGIMQGRKKFFAFGSNLVIEGIVKVVLAVILVYSGMKIFGAVIAIVIAVLVSFLLSFIPLISVLRSQQSQSSTYAIKSYTFPVIFVNFLILAFASLDVFAASILLTKEAAGYYSIASIVAKIIFLGTTPISKAMFPISTENSIKNERSSTLIGNAFLILCSLIIIALPFYYLMPSFLIRAFSGKYIIESASILFSVAIAFSFISLSNLALLYKLSLGKLRITSLFFVFHAFFIAIILFAIVHLHTIGRLLSLETFSLYYIISSAILLVSSLVLLLFKYSNNKL